MEKIAGFIKTHKVPLILIAIILIGFLVRLIGIDSDDGLWYDEAYSWWVANQSFPFGIIEKLRFEDYHPPLYHFILHFWIKLFGTSDVAARFLSVIISTCTIGVVYLVGKEIKDKTCGLICAALYTFLIFNLTYAQEVRFYPLSVAFAMLSLLFVAKIFNKGNLKAFVGLVISNTLLIYTLSTGAFFVAIENLVLLVFLIVHKKELIKKFIIAQFATLLVCIPQFMFMLGQYLRGKMAILKAWEPMSFDPTLIFEFVSEWFSPRFFWHSEEYGFEIYNHFYAVLTLILFFIIASALYKLIFSKNKIFHIYFSIFIIYLAFLLLFCQLKIMPFNYYYTGILAGMFIVTLGYSITEHKQKHAALLFIGILLFEIYFSFKTYTEFKYIALYRPYGIKIPIEFLKNKKYDENTILFMPWGGKLMGKYASYIKTNGIYFDDIFLYNLPKNQSLVLDDDLYALSYEDRLKYIRKYILKKKPSKALENNYENTIESLPVGGHFALVLDFDFEHYDREARKAQNSYSYEKGIKLYMLAGKIANDFLNLASQDKRVELIEKQDNPYENGFEFSPCGTWNIFVFKKIKP